MAAVLKISFTTLGINGIPFFRHLARNPFVCDCNLRWLADYLHKNPKKETSGARCESPKRMQRRKIESLRDEKFKCTSQRYRHRQLCRLLILLAVDNRVIKLVVDTGIEDAYREPGSSECDSDITCPNGCTCDGTIVDCSGLRLTEVPKAVSYTHLTLPTIYSV